VIIERRADRARDRLDRQGDAVLFGDVGERGQAIEVALQVAVAVGKLPQVEDDEPRSELARDPAVEREPREIGIVAGEGRTRPLVGVGGDERQTVQVLGDALVPGRVDRRLELERRDVLEDPAVVGEVGVAGDRPRRDQRPHAARAAGIRPWEEPARR